MFKKLVNGELSLRETFWKFGVFGTLLIHFIVKFLAHILAGKLGGITIYKYYTQHFNPTKIDSGLLILTLAYLSGLCILLSYCITVVLGVWRSAAEYDRSIWLRHISRLLILVLVFVVLRFYF